MKHQSILLVAGALSLASLSSLAAERPVITVNAPDAGGDATALVQGALDDAWRRGGATVLLESGLYNVKGLRLRSKTKLHLRAGALLLGSRDCADYAVLRGDALEPVPADEFTDAVWQPVKTRKSSDHITKCASAWNDALIRIYAARDVEVFGEPGSVIDGNNSYDPKGEELYRGVHGISAHRSTNVVLRGYTLVNTGNWSHNLMYCANVSLDGLTIAGGHDGVHMSSTDDVRISRLSIDTGDDCIAGFDCERVRVSDCRLRSSCNLFRLGGYDIRVERCDCSGPASYAFRSALTREQRTAGASGFGAAPRNPLSFFTYYCDFTFAVRRPAGEIVFRDCRVRNVDRFLHFNYSGNDFWQKNRPLTSVAFESVDAQNVAKSLCLYGDAELPVALKMTDCRLAFGRVGPVVKRGSKGQKTPTGPVVEFIRACNVRSLELDDVTVEGVDGPCVRSFGSVEGVKIDGVKGVRPVVEKSSAPFVAHQI